MSKYVALLRGINVSGHHKVPMAELRKEMENLNFEKVITILNSGNIIFDSTKGDAKSLEKTISDHLAKTFGFPIPTIIRKSEMMYDLLDRDPFKDILVTKDIRLYVSFLKEDVETDLQLPWTSDNNAFKIIDKIDKTIVSVLDLSITKTPKGMEVLERYFGKHITTRNWNTIKRIEKKLEANL
ncbi:DUF1697 domain-containing protein [Aquimarina macrocephali]|uniref:DUF1697 domain-containing protein n=1 Tax=Aquimarina macrocephali TaxID=666563 RepID=UPI0004638D45|nr:DUF1697 domain-containing protein [Aquimarina macrocephali]